MEVYVFENKFWYTINMPLNFLLFVYHFNNHKWKTSKLKNYISHQIYNFNIKISLFNIFLKIYFQEEISLIERLIWYSNFVLFFQEFY